uniref:Uncharacterized protein n=1 Tax=Ignisphaera aggregans TaxID=334771 RepID=A0A7C5TGP1_9CREN
MKHRSVERCLGKRFYQGNIYVDEIEIITPMLLSKLLNVRHIESTPTSDTIVNSITFTFNL